MTCEFCQIPDFFLILLLQVEGFDDLSPNECIILVETSIYFLGIKNLIRLDWFRGIGEGLMMFNISV